MEMEIQQCCRLRIWPPLKSTLDSPEVARLFSRALGQRRHDQYGEPDFLMLYACACDKLQWCIGEKLLKAEPICADRYPAMKQLQDLLRDEAPLTLSRNAIVTSMAHPPVLNTLPQSIFKSVPKEKLRSLSSDIIFVLRWFASRYRIQSWK